MKLRGIPIGKAKIKDGKIVTTVSYASVSERIRQKSSKRIRPKKGPRL